MDDYQRNLAVGYIVSCIGTCHCHWRDGVPAREKDSTNVGNRTSHFGDLRIRHGFGKRKFECRLDSSTGSRLVVAIDNDDSAGLDDILASEHPDLEQFLPGFSSITPLLHAVIGGNVDAVRQLLKAGANPDARNRGQSLSPLFQAIRDGNDPLIRLLEESGADLDQLIGNDQRMSPIAWCISQGAVDRAALLLELGADPDVRDNAGWTALMDALFREQLDAVDLLLPVSDPRIVSTDDITRHNINKSLDLRFLPRGNALFFALRMRSVRGPEIAETLRKRAAELDPDAGVQQLELFAQQSVSRLDWFEGRKQAAIDAHRKALSTVDVPSSLQFQGYPVVQGGEELECCIYS